MNYVQVFSALLPEAIVVVAALLVLAVDLLFMREATNDSRLKMAVVLVFFGCAAAIAAIAWAKSMNLLDGMLVLTSTAYHIKQIILMLTIITGVISLESHFTKHIGEYFALLLLAAVGMM